MTLLVAKSRTNKTFLYNRVLEVSVRGQAFQLLQAKQQDVFRLRHRADKVTFVYQNRTRVCRSETHIW